MPTTRANRLLSPCNKKSPAGANACGAYILEEMPEGASDISGEVPHLAEPDVTEIVFTNE